MLPNMAVVWARVGVDVSSLCLLQEAVAAADRPVLLCCVTMEKGG